MTTEEKAKRYDEAFQIAKNVWRFSSNNAEIMRMEELFPELRESEGERIRKELIGFLRNIPNSNYTCEEMALWLEKQGQVKESEISQPIKGTSKENDNSLTKKAWSEDDETNLTNTIIMLKEGASHHFTNFSIVPCVDWLKSLKDRVQPQPKHEWSLEDERVIAIINNALTESNTPPDDYDKVYDWLESLRQKIGG